MPSIFQNMRSPGKPQVGTWVKIESLVTLEILADAGYDFVVIDLEHSPISLEWVHIACAIAQPREVGVVVRMPDSTGAQIQRVLDLGVDGVILPQLRSAAETDAVIGAAMFPPRGRRGVATTTRAGRWGTHTRETYIQHGDQAVLRCIQFETAESFDDIEAMLDVSGVNAALFGRVDLSVALDLPVTDPKLQQLSATLVRQASRRSIPCGTAVNSVAEAREAIGAGFTFVIVGNDATMFTHAVAGVCDSVRATERADHTRATSAAHGDSAPQS